MKLVDYILTSSRKYDSAVRKLIKALYMTVIILLILTAVMLSCGEEMFSDYDTAYYYAEQTFLNSTYIINIGIIFIMAAEMLNLKEN